MAGGSARGLGARVKTAALSRGSSARSISAASLSSRIDSTATVPSGTEPRQRGDAGRVVRAVVDRQRVVRDDLEAPGDAGGRGGDARVDGAPRTPRAASAERAPARRRAAAGEVAPLVAGSGRKGDAASLSSRIDSTATVPSGTESASAAMPGALCAPS